MIENIEKNGVVQAVILRATFRRDGVEFFTPNNFSQQLGYMNHPAGYVIQPHVHNAVAREVLYTKEVLFIKSGMVRVDFYADDHQYYQSSILNAGDIILLAFLLYLTV
jgi:hypothetical protein